MTLATSHVLHQLAGGARLITAPMPFRASTSVVLMFGVGSRFEEERLGGASHFIEHLLFKGTSKRPSSKAIAEAIEGVGGMINASTDKEVTAYWCRVPGERLELAIDVLFDIVANSVLKPADIDRERLVILEELKMYQDQPQDFVHSLFDQVMWPNHPLGRDIVGSVESLNGMTRDDLVGYLSGHYQPRNLVAALAGSLEDNVARELMESRLTPPNGDTHNDFTPAPPPLTAPKVLLHSKPTEQAHIVLGTRAISYLDPDRYILDLINAILGQGMSSRLFLEIREKRGLAYDVHAFASLHRDAGYFAVYMGVDAKKAEEALDAAIKELRKMVDEEVGEAELTKVKEFKKGNLRLSLESTSSMANWLGQNQLLMGRIKTVEEVIGIIDAITPADIKRVAAEVLDAPIQMAVIGPFESDSVFRSAIGA
jgi:predicted Zn-dependent peptidase